MVPGNLGCASVVVAATTMLAPSRAARRPMALPMPRLAPVMNRVLPESPGIQKSVISCVRICDRIGTSAHPAFRSSMLPICEQSFQSPFEGKRFIQEQMVVSVWNDDYRDVAWQQLLHVNNDLWREQSAVLAIDYRKATFYLAEFAGHIS